jgi:hypothetical protein
VNESRALPRLVGGCNDDKSWCSEAKWPVNNESGVFQRDDDGTAPVITGERHRTAALARTPSEASAAAVHTAKKHALK